jgi:hypothetical protein
MKQNITEFQERVKKRFEIAGIISKLVEVDDEEYKLFLLSKLVTNLKELKII